jgi:nicotinate-nucleotide adenylyltransferase
MPHYLLGNLSQYLDSKLTVGILGGSFNPAHEGHLASSVAIKNKFKLDKIWWLVSPGNPLKSAADKLNFNYRYQSAVQVASSHGFIHPTDIETRIKTVYTYDTINQLKKLFPKIKFIWLMGADNLVSFHKWHKWREIMDGTPVIVYDRDNLSHAAIHSKAYIYATKPSKAMNLSCKKKLDKDKNLIYLHLRKQHISSTQIRRGK